MRLKKFLFLCAATSVLMSSVTMPAYAAKQMASERNSRNVVERSQRRSFSRTMKRNVPNLIQIQ